MPEARKITLILLFIFCQSTSSFAVTEPLPAADTAPHKLLYIVEVFQKDKANDKGNDFMIPYIEQKLKNLRYANEDKRLYDSVVSLNIITRQTNIQSSIITSLINNRIISSPIAEADIQKDPNLNYVKFMQAYDETLLIKINTFNNLIEFQFTLFQRVQGGSGIHYANSSSVFVNPDKPHYQTDIINTLNQVFEKASSKPLSSIVSNKTKTADNIYFLTSEDTLVLEPIIDDGSPEDDRIYFWNQNFKDSVRANVEVSKKDQKFKNLKPGSYKLSFKVSNGINYSTTDTVRLVVYVKPSLKIDRLQGKFLFEAGMDHLIIQEYLLGYKHIDGFVSYTARINQKEFAGIVPDLYIKIADKKGETYVEKQYAFSAASPNSMPVNDDAHKIIDDINFMNNSFKAIGSNKYTISFMAKNANMQSIEQKRDLDIFQRRAVSLVYDAVISPLSKYRNRLFDSWFNIALGLDLRMNKFLFISALVGTDASNKSFSHLYTNFIANLTIPGSKFEGGPAIFIGSDNSTISLGFKISYILFQNGRANLKIGDSYYNRGLSDYYSLHCTGNIFFNH